MLVIKHIDLDIFLQVCTVHYVAPEVLKKSRAAWTPCVQVYSAM